MSNVVSIERGDLSIATISGCATCGADVCGHHAPAFAISLPDASLRFHLCPACILTYGGSLNGSARKRFKAAVLARLAAITQDIKANERRAALHPEGGRA
jgi:hypothetical protein